VVSRLDEDDATVDPICNGLAEDGAFIVALTS